MYIAFIIIGVLVLLFFAFLLYVYDTAFYNSMKKRFKKPLEMRGEQYEKFAVELKESVDNMLKEEYIPVEITSYDGLKLKARYYHFKDGAPTDIIFHGYRSFAMNDCGGGFKIAQEMGYNVLLPDNRGHGQSEGKNVTFGIKDRLDCLAWTYYLARKYPDSPQFISGISMGAATVLMASDLDFPKQVKGIVADCPYSAPEDIILKAAKDMGYPAKVARPFVYAAARMFAGFRLNETSAMDAVKNAQVPVLIIHGEDDRFVPCEMSRKIFDACNGKKKLLIVKNAGHGLSYFADGDAYRKAVKDFKNAAISGDDDYFA